MSAPFGVLGIRTQDGFLTGLDFLPPGTPTLSPRRDTVTHLVCVQLLAYFDNPGYRFDLPLRLAGTRHQLRVWEALRDIPRGRPVTYGELARKLGSAARAVGQACGRNPVPVVVPCHRVISASGALGGFMGGTADGPLAIKRWLLSHEGWRG